MTGPRAPDREGAGGSGNPPVMPTRRPKRTDRIKAKCA
ncbi:hypothetical protein PY32053_01800 [Paracoccus yeei]|uniref:Uncharacterized protein n=1 Tax=Paracoccus yeei TaxID=147645 RepID=A0A386UL32_9RHOB|nr:hypothetical protein PY32053_01800 [Paracoccus yeei]